MPREEAGRMYVRTHFPDPRLPKAVEELGATLLLKNNDALLHSVGRTIADTNGTVMIVDDDPRELLEVRAALERAGVPTEQITQFDNSESALVFAREKMPITPNFYIIADQNLTGSRYSGYGIMQILLRED